MYIWCLFFVNNHIYYVPHNVVRGTEFKKLVTTTAHKCKKNKKCDILDEREIARRRVYKQSKDWQCIYECIFGVCFLLTTLFIMYLILLWADIVAKRYE